jgi:hypothetical protein
MASRLVIPGGTYCDMTPSGKYCALIPTQYQDFPNGSFAVTVLGHIDTHLGPIALPAGEVSTRGQGPLMLRCTDVGGGGFQMCGKPHQQAGFVWLWQQTTGLWTQVAPDSFGVSGHIFDLTGVLFIHTAAPPVDVQGYRYVNDANGLIAGSATYADPSRDLYEYSEYDCAGTHVAIGQGGHGGIVAVTGALGSTHRSFRLETGFTWFCRFKHTAGALSVAIWSVSLGSSILRLLNVTDLVAGGVVVQGGGGVAADCH